LENYLLGLVSIAVSVALYYLGYRQTIGARKERIHNANSEFEKILMRRVVLEDYHPNSKDLSRLASGIAHEYNIRVRDLLFDLQVLDNIYTKIFENDFLLPEKRDQILRTLSSSSAEIAKEFEEDVQTDESSTITSRSQPSFTIAIVLGLFASLIGVLVSIIPTLADRASVMIPMVGTVFGVSLLVIGAVVLFSRLNESQEEPNSVNTAKLAQGFEREVIKILGKTGTTITPAKMDAGFDFTLSKGQNRYLLIIKVAPKLNIHNLERSITNLKRALQADGSQEGLIITKKPIEMSGASLKMLRGENIHILSLSEARDYLAK
jgi:hypothetical protein